VGIREGIRAILKESEFESKKSPAVSRHRAF